MKKKVFGFILLILGWAVVYSQDPSISPAGTRSICPGDSLKINVTNLNSGDTYVFQWLKDGQPIADSTRSSIVVKVAGAYTVDISKNGGDIENFGPLTLSINQSPNANFTFDPSSGCGKTTVRFTNTSDNGNAGQTSNLTYQWTFGNGKNSTKKDPDPVRFSPTAGNSGSQTFNIQLIVTNTTTQCKDTVSYPLTLGKGADATLTTNLPIVDFNGEPYFANCTSFPTSLLTFTNTSQTTNTEYFIDWGDNSNTETLTSLATINHTYSIGTFKLRYIVKGGGCTDSTTYNIFVGSNPAIGAASRGNTKICTGDSLTFDLTKFKNNPAGTIYTITINDGSAPRIYTTLPADSAVTIRFDKSSCGVLSNDAPNAFKFTIRAENPCGFTTVQISEIYISQKSTPDFTISPSNIICVNTPIKLTYAGKNGENIIQSAALGQCDAGNFIWQISSATGWTLAAGQDLGSDNSSPNNSNDWRPGSSVVDLNFTQPGSYTIKMRSGSTQCGIVDTTKVICVNPTPDIFLSIDKVSICQGESVTASSVANNSPTCGIYAYSWTAELANVSGCAAATQPSIVGQGTGSATYTFSTPGIYNVVLTVTAPGGCTVVKRLQVEVKGKPVVSLGTINPFCASGTISPIANISCYTTGASYSWTFTGGTPTGATTSTPSVTYATSGDYNISVDVTNTCGVTTAQQTVTVKPVPSVNSVGNISVCAGVSTSAVNFSSSLVGTTFSWTNSNSTIGLGASGTGAIPVFSAVNNTSSSITANVSVTPTLNGCSGTPLNFTITVLPKPSVNITGGGNTCINQSITLTANITANGTGANYSWSPTSSTASSITITPSTSGIVNYTVTVTNSDGCVNTASSSITANALPTVTINPSSASICIGSSVSLIASGAASYSWSPSTGLSSSIGSNISASPITNTTYTVTGTNGPGCTSSATTTITVNPLPNVTVNSPTMCFNVAASLIASGADTYSWTPSTGLSATSGATINANPTSTTSYTVTGRNSSTTCVNTATALVTVNPLPIITVNSPTICPGVSTTLIASGAVTYSWTPSSNLSSSTGDAVTASPTTTTTYQVTGTDNNLCSKSVTSIVTVTPLPTISATKQDPTTCGGSNGTITVSGLNNGTNYTVKYTYLNVEYTRTGVASGGAVIISGLSSGTYTNIYVTFSGCNSTSIGPYTLSDPSAPTAPTLLTSSTICSGQDLVLNISNPVPGAIYTWTGPGLNSSLLNQTSLTIQNAPISAAGTYQVTASLNGCISAAGSANVNVNPTPSIPVVVNVPYCQGESPNQLSASYDASNTLYWYSSNTGGTQTLTAPTPSTATATTLVYYVSQITPLGCESQRAKLDVIVSPIPVIQVSKNDPVTCSGANGSLVITGFTANTTYQVYYKKDGTPVNKILQADATGKITITGLTQGDYSEIYVTLGSCTSNIVSTTFQLRDPLPPVQPILSSNSPICSGNTLTLTVTNPVAGATYDWVGPNGFVQLASLSNVLSRPSSTLLMNGSYSVTMTLANCISPIASQQVIVNQTPSKPIVTDPPPYCQGATATALTASIDPGNILKWYSPGVVLPSGPTGPTPLTNTVGSVTYLVSQTTTPEGCESETASIVVTVSRTPFISDKTITNCSEAAINYTPAEAPIGTQYTWGSPLIIPSGSISGATSQASPTTSFSQLLKNLTNANATSEYVLTPSVGTCPGPTFKILITIEPKASIASETLNPICSEGSFNFTPTTSGSNIIPSNTLYKWTIASISPAGAIVNATSQTIPSASLSQTLTNISSVTARIVYTITPVSGNCTGPAFTLTVDVNPKPKIQDIPLIICSGQPFSAVPINNPPGTIVPAATSYTWPTPISSGPNAISGGVAQASGTSVIGQTLVNNTISTQTITYIVTPTTGSCSGPDFRVIVTVNPQPNIAPKKEIVCSGTAFSIVPSDAPIGTLYTWTIPTVEAPGNISGAIAQTSPVSIISQLLTNNKNYPAKVTYNVSPSSGSCGGSGFSVEIIVNPKPVISTLKDTICNGEVFSIIPTDGVSNAIVPDLTTYTWALPTSLPNGAVTGGSAQPTSQTTIQQALFNASDAPGILNYRVTPVSGSFGNCPGPIFNVSVLVNPDAKARFSPTDTIGCPPYLINANRVGLQQFTQRNAEYIWYIDGQLNGTGAGLPNYKILNEDDTIQLKLVTTSLYGCKSDSAFKKFITYKLPHPEFSVSKNDDCGPYTVSFINNTPYKEVFGYNWTFGNGLTSSKSDPDPVQFLPNPSFGDTIYTVRLDVTSVCNIVSYEQKIRVKSKPKALFSPTSTIGCSPFKVVFNNTSRGVNNRYVWDFGDGRKDSVLIRDTISHIYYTTIRDTFTVKLYAINECGIDSSSFNIIVSPNTIKLDFAVNGEEKEGCIQHTVRFINNTSGASAFRWNFGDGNTRSTIKNIDTVFHTYLQPGKYTITLFATNGCTDTLSTEEVTVYGLPTPDFGVSKFNVCIGDSIFFKNKSTDADSYLWDLGDGKRVTFVDPGHRYANKGTYQVKLFAFKTNSPGIVCVDSIIRTINIVDTVNVAFDVSDSVSNCAPFRVVFNNFYRDNIYAEWNFGDGVKLRGDSVTHIFNKTGRYDVNLYVKASGGCNYIGSKPIIINSPTGTASFKSGYSCIDESIRFEAIPFATDSILWDFGDGISFKTDKRVVYHQYQNPGVYVPTITLLSSLGCAFKVNISDTIKIDKVISGFSYLQEEFCGYTRVDFKDTTNAFFGKAKVEWKFGDGESGSLFKQPHNFKSSNTYLVESIVTGISGCSDTSFRNVPVFVRSIPAVQIGGDTVSCTGNDLKLQAFVKSQDSITLQKWVTSNGSIVYGDTYKNIYAQPASYIFSFISGTKYGCYDTTKVTLNIYPTPIVKAAPDVTICQGNSISINATGADTYSWYPSEGLSCINCKDPVASPDKATPYTVKGTTKYGCYAYDTILVKVIPRIKIEAFRDDSICIGESVQLLATGAKYYEWSPSVGLSATDIQNPVANPTRTTRYRVVGFDEYSCFRDTAYVFIGVGGYPKVDLGPDQLLATGSLFQLKPKFTEGPIKTWSWGPDKDLSCINCASPIVRVRNQITYFVTATNYYGCSGSDTISIKVFCENAQVYIPNAFTPDNDGNNDIFMVRASGIQEVKSFRIFNRWGELLFDKANFQPNDPSFAWDGRIRGVIPGPDVFVYTVEVICDDGTPYFYKGNVSLLK